MCLKFLFLHCVCVTREGLDDKTMDLKEVVFPVCHWVTFLLTPFLTYTCGTFLSQSSKSVNNTKQLGRQHLKQVRKCLDFLFPCTCTTFYPQHFFPCVQVWLCILMGVCQITNLHLFWSWQGIHSGSVWRPICSCASGPCQEIVLASLFSQCGSKYFPFNCKNPPKFDRIESLKSPHGPPQ